MDAFWEPTLTKFCSVIKPLQMLELAHHRCCSDEAYGARSLDFMMLVNHEPRTTGVDLHSPEKTKHSAATHNKRIVLASDGQFALTTSEFKNKPSLKNGKDLTEVSLFIVLTQSDNFSPILTELNPPHAT